MQEANIARPTLPETNIYSSSIKIFPSECRQRKCTYRGKLSLTFRWMVDGVMMGSFTKVAGLVPIMVKVRRVGNGRSVEAGGVD